MQKVPSFNLHLIISSNDNTKSVELGRTGSREANKQSKVVNLSMFANYVMCLILGLEEEREIRKRGLHLICI